MVSKILMHKVRYRLNQDSKLSAQFQNYGKAIKKFRLKLIWFIAWKNHRGFLSRKNMRFHYMAWCWTKQTFLGQSSLLNKILQISNFIFKVSNKKFDEFLEFHYPNLFFRIAGGFIPNKYNAYYNHFVYGDNCDQIRCREF